VPESRMQLKILLPSRVFWEMDEVTRIVAETRQGSFGILPHRVDCVAALAAGILSYTTATANDVYVAVDEGVLVKMGAQVVVSVRHAIGGADLGQLRQAVALRERINPPIGSVSSCVKIPKRGPVAAVLHSAGRLGQWKTENLGQGGAACRAFGSAWACLA
jgi:F-type H+-transporting ATPase subunit epsilon